MVRPHLPLVARLLAAAALAGFALTGCVDPGDDDNAGGSSDTGSGAAAVDETVAVSLASPDEFSIAIEPASAAGGLLRFEVTNTGALLHEFALVRFEDDPSTLPVTGASVDRAAVPFVAEVENLDPGDTGSVDVALEAGTYVVFCDIPGHYPAGMFTLFIVE